MRHEQHVKGLPANALLRKIIQASGIEIDKTRAINAFSS